MPDTCGSRGKWAVLVPASNSVVEPELNSIRPADISMQAGRIVNEDMSKFSELGFEEFVDQSILAIDTALDSVLKLEPDYLVLGYSAPGWRPGADAALRSRLQEVSGIGVTTPGIAFVNALSQLGVKRIAIVSPYPKSFLHVVNKFFADWGLELGGHVSIPCASATDIAKVTDRMLIDAVEQADDASVECIVQVGGNLPMLSVAEIAERWLGKPVLSMTSVLLWHALRSNQFDDVVKGGGLIFRH
jgi:maleate isomerase